MRVSAATCGGTLGHTAILMLNLVQVAGACPKRQSVSPSRNSRLNVHEDSLPLDEGAFNVLSCAGLDIERELQGSLP